MLLTLSLNVSISFFKLINHCSSAHLLSIMAFRYRSTDNLGRFGTFTSRPDQPPRAIAVPAKVRRTFGLLLVPDTTTGTYDDTTVGWVTQATYP